MKTKHFLTAALMAMCAMATTMFTACGSDSDDNNNNGGKKGPVSAGLVCSLMTDDETLLNFDFYAKYYDANGQVQTEKVVWGEKRNEQGYRIWTKTVTAKLPATLGMHCQIKAKEGVEYDPNTRYMVGHGFLITSSLLDEACKSLSDVPGYVSEYIVSRIRQGSIYEFLENENNFLNVVYYFDANGNRTNGNWN